MDAMMRFYLGTHMPHWLGQVDVPLFVSHRRLVNRRTLPRAISGWALDSGSFSEVGLHGEFTTTVTEYVVAVRRYRDQIGQLEWAAPQDHMCEPFVLRRSSIARTVEEAQKWTTANLLALRWMAPDLPIIPVLQGLAPDDYRRHADIYHAAGIDLTAEPLVGVGSVCRRQGSDEIARLVCHLAFDGVRLHGFGVKMNGLSRIAGALASADSLAWSFNGRRVHPCPHSDAQSCANCLDHALAWRDRLLATMGDRPVQMALAGV